MDSRRRDFNPQSWGLYYSRSVSFYMISAFISLIYSKVSWSVQNRVVRTTLIRVWDPCDMARVAGRETPDVVINVAASSKEGSEAPTAITWC